MDLLLADALIYQMTDLPADALIYQMTDVSM
jgi:hypothetical protein